MGLLPKVPNCHCEDPEFTEGDEAIPYFERKKIASLRQPAKLAMTKNEFGNSPVIGFDAFLHHGILNE